MPTISRASAKVFSTPGESEKPFIMPTDCEPWPGKTMANDTASVFQEHGAPGEAATHALQQDRVAPAHAAIADRHIERERHRGGGGVGVPVHGDDTARFGQTELAAHMGDDAHVGLVRD